MSKYAVVLALPDYIQDDVPEPGCCVVYVQADLISEAISCATEQAVESYKEDGYGCKPDEFAHLVTFEGHPSTLQFGSSA